MMISSFTLALVIKSFDGRAKKKLHKTNSGALQHATNREQMRHPSCVPNFETILNHTGTPYQLCLPLPLLSEPSDVIHCIQLFQLFPLPWFKFACASQLRRALRPYFSFANVAQARNVVLEPPWFVSSVFHLTAVGN